MLSLIYKRNVKSFVNEIPFKAKNILNYLLIKLKSKFSGLGSRNIDCSSGLVVAGRLLKIGVLVVVVVAGRWGSKRRH